MKHLSLTILAFLLSFASFAQVAAISGPSSFCVGSTGIYSDATPGGVWSSSNMGVAVIGTGTGVATGIAAGVTTISYTVGPSYATMTVTVNPGPGAITGPSAVCLSIPTTYTNGTSGGTWSSSVPACATINPSTGVLFGVSPGTTIIAYTLGTGCFITKSVTVEPLPAAITGASSVCLTMTTTLSDATPGGTWSSSNPMVASIDPFGVITGNGIGVATIAYTAGTGCAATKSLTVNSTSATYTVTGGGPYCAGGTGVHIGLSGSDIGSSYQLYNGASPVGGPVSGTGSALDFGLLTAAGTYTVVANPGTGCATSMTGSVTITISALPTVFVVTGGGGFCLGGTGYHIGLASSSTGISYQLINGITTVGSPIPGTGSALDFGIFTTTGTYTVVGTNITTGCSNNMSGSAVITVYSLPNVYNVTGGGAYCVGGTGVHIGLDGSDAGVNYQLYLGLTMVGSPVPGTGLAIDFGLVTPAGTYTVVAINPTTGCTSNMSGSATVSTSPILTPSVTISTTPGTTVCAGTVVLFTANPVNGGTSPTYVWSVNGVAAATGPTYTYIPATGDVISVVMTSSAPCASPTTASDNVVMTISVPSVAATITSAGTCDGSMTMAATGATTYSWSPSTGLACPTCSSNTFIPTTTTTYAVTGTDTYGCTGSATVVADANRISGHITYTGTPSTDTFKIWLIQFNPSDSSITATDSTLNCIYPYTPYYEFLGKPAGNYMVKAKLLGGTPGTSGYIPTYSLSSPHWDSAATIAHTTTTADSMHIDMVYGTVPSGPGFIGGYVYMGAGKGTSGEVAAPGMIIYLKNAAGTILTYTYTSPTGAYSFNGLANGSYIIYPEDYGYRTSPSALVTLTTTAETVNAINFKKHTTYGTITPFDNTSVNQVLGAANGFSIYPNPTTGEVNLQWSNKATGTAQLTISDVTGREVYNTSVNMATPSGQSHINVGNLEEGLYIISIKAAGINYTGRLIRIKG